MKLQKKNLLKLLNKVHSKKTSKRYLKITRKILLDGEKHLKDELQNQTERIMLNKKQR